MKCKNCNDIGFKEKFLEMAFVNFSINILCICDKAQEIDRQNTVAMNEIKKNLGERYNDFVSFIQGKSVPSSVFEELLTKDRVRKYWLEKFNLVAR